MQTLAPIGLSVYGRLEHTKKTIKALQANTLAKESHLYIFSDGPKKGDEDKIAQMRNYLKTIDGFKRVEIIARKENSRIANTRNGHKYLLNRYGKMIWMAEDIVTAPSFLSFMNAALDYYETNKTVFSIVGYSPAFTIRPDYPKDFFVLRRFSAWGFGIWKDRYDQIDTSIDMEKYSRLMDDPVLRNQFATYGVDMLELLRKEADGVIDALDVKIMFHQFWTDQLTVYPRHSLVQNIGHDGSGVHCGETDRFHHERLWDKSGGFRFDDDLEPDRAIVQANYEFRFIYNDDTKSQVIEDLLGKIIGLARPRVALWGIGEITALLLPRLKAHGIEVSRFIDSRASDTELYFDGKRVVTLEQALQQGERHIVITSWGSRHAMHETALAHCRSVDEPVAIIVPEAHPPA